MDTIDDKVLDELRELISGKLTESEREKFDKLILRMIEPMFITGFQMMIEALELNYKLVRKD